MKSTDQVLAYRYSRALYEAALMQSRSEKSKGPVSVQEDLANATKALRDKQVFFRHPLIPAAQKKKAVRDLLGPKASDLLLRFLDLLIEKKRFDLLSLTATKLEQIVSSEQGVVRVQVRSASELTQEECRALEARLKKFSGKSVLLETKTDPDLIGGMVVRIGDLVLDASVKNQLRRLKTKLAEAS